MCARRCACCLTFFVRVPLSACGSGSPALCGSRLAPSAILLFLWILWPLSLFLSPSPAPLGPGLYILYPHFVSRDREIPIPALRMEGDTCIISLKTGAVNISIHALRVEGDAYFLCRSSRQNRHFYPRPPGGGRPPRASRSARSWRNFYPRPPGGGRRGCS